MLVHGGQAWAYTWRNQVEPLAEAGYHVIVPDLPGCGYSEASNAADYSISALACFFGDFLDELKIQKAVFICNSTGGLPVLDFATRFPERVAALVLASGSGVPHDLPTLWKLVRWPKTVEPVGLSLNEGVVRSNLQEALYDESILTDEMVSAYLEPLRREETWNAIGNLEQSWNPSFVEGQIQCIRCPTLVIWGGNDPWHPVRLAYEFGRLIPGSQVEILPACGHLPQEERPEKFNRLVLTFLSNYLKS